MILIGRGLDLEEKREQAEGNREQEKLEVGARAKAKGWNETWDRSLDQMICEECQRETEADMVSQPKGPGPVRF